MTMDEKDIVLADIIPMVVALVLAIVVASYMLQLIVLELLIARPSSTIGVGFIFIPIYALIAAGIGCFLGYLLKNIALKYTIHNQINKVTFIRSIIIVTLFGIILSGIFAWQQIQSYEKYNAPRILSNKAHFVKSQYQEELKLQNSIPSQLIWSHGDINSSLIQWNNHNLFCEISNATNMKIISDKQVKAVYDFKDYTSYISKIEILSNEYLIVLVKLRATSFRSMLLIYDGNFELIYEELLERCNKSDYMYLISEQSEELLSVNSCQPFSIKLK